MKIPGSPLFAALLTFSLATLPLAAQNFDDVEVEVHPVADGVYMLTGAGGNIGLSVGDDGAFIVDDQFAPLTERIKATIATVTDQPVRFVLNTHWHGDHTGGNENFGGEGALIVAHDNVFKRMNPEAFAELVGRSNQAPVDALPKITFSETMTFHWNGQDLHVFHVHHAHTDGDAIVHFADRNVVHMGDTFFNGFYPFLDVASGGSANGMIEAADRVLALSGPETRIIPGHGPLAGVEELRAYKHMLITVRDRVLEMKNGGATEDEVVAAGPTAEFDGDWNRPDGDDWRDNFVRFVYQSLR